MAEIRVSELPAAGTLQGTDLIMVAQENSSSASGYISNKTTTSALADKINNSLTYNGLNTTAKTIIGAINENKANEVEANPQGTASTSLTKIKVGNNIYSIDDTGSIVSVFQTLSSGTEIAGITVDGNETKLYAPTPTTVEANPAGTGSTDLTKLNVGGIIYNIPSGGSGGASALEDLTDVNIQTASNGQFLTYNSTSGKWANETKMISLTQAQYDVLPSADKNNGAIYFITDSSSGGGGSSSVIDYSTTEQDTGVKWIDGSSIYCITYVSQSLSNNILITSDVADVIDMKAYCNTSYDGRSNYHFHGSTYNPDFSLCFCIDSNNDLYIRPFLSSAETFIKIVVTVYYTKTV